MTPIKNQRFFENSILLLRDSFFKRKGWGERGRKGEREMEKRREEEVI